MNSKGWHIALALISMAMLVVVALKFARWTVSGQIIDAESGEPVHGANVAIVWREPRFETSGARYMKPIEKAHATTDDRGRFELPRHSTLFSGKEFELVVYRDRYVCWDNIHIFPFYEKREDVRLHDDMKIRLEPFKKHYSKEAHALFVAGLAARMPAGLLEGALKSEQVFRPVPSDSHTFIFNTGVAPEGSPPSQPME